MSTHDASSSKTPSAYEQKPAVELAAYAAAKGAGAGLLVSAVQNALETHSRGATGILTRTGGTVGLFAAMAGTFAYTDATVANLRQTNDALNGAAGGCAAGFLAGIRMRSLPIAVGSCAVLGAAVGTLDAGGGTLMGDGRVAEGYEAREERRKAFFKPRREEAVTSE
ncbi:hypothetical protein DL93DRAFT_1810798 [Clavulina sp. PMI_390]|nr:hypothetical protein DL93DRAFT_1810798 [Clavulina sp. PMI_390]